MTTDIPATAAASRRRRQRVDDRGASTVEFAILYPVLLLFLMLLVQAALIFHAQNVAATAAKEGVARAAAFDGTAAAGEARTRRYLGVLGGDRLLQTATVSGTRSATDAQITVRGTSLSLLPGLSPRINESAADTVERLPEEAP